MTTFEIRALTQKDRAWVAQFLDKHWGSTSVVSRGQSYYAHLLPGFVAETPDGEHIGMATYRVDGADCELMTLDSVEETQGVGSALLDAVKEAAREEGCKRLWLVTTNDNLHALQFYQKREFQLVAVHRGAIAEARRIKPQIALIGKNGIPIRDEIELECPL